MGHPTYRKSVVGWGGCWGADLCLGSEYEADSFVIVMSMKSACGSTGLPFICGKQLGPSLLTHHPHHLLQTQVTCSGDNGTDAYRHIQTQRLC